jgi:hypothetical protein
MPSKALVCDIHVSEADELLGGGLDSAPTLRDPGAVSKDEGNDNRVGDG